MSWRTDSAAAANGTGPTASACSDRLERRTRRTMSPRSSRASCSARTTSTAARGSATRRAPPRSRRCSAPARRPTASTTSSGRARILVCGANPTENHPVVGARIKQAVAAGARLIVIDPRRIELAEYADCHCRRAPARTSAAERDGARDRRARSLSTTRSWPRGSTGSTSSCPSIRVWTARTGGSRDCGVEAGLIDARRGSTPRRSRRCACTGWG